jgi:hypothetical protein
LPTAINSVTSRDSPNATDPAIIEGLLPVSVSSARLSQDKGMSGVSRPDTGEGDHEGNLFPVERVV